LEDGCWEAAGVFSSAAVCSSSSSVEDRSGGNSAGRFDRRLFAGGFEFGRVSCGPVPVVNAEAREIL